jgi:hypothetical protein
MAVSETPSDVVALIDSPAFCSRAVGAVLWRHEKRSVMLQDADEALRRTPELRPSVLVIPDTIDASPFELAARLRVLMGAASPHLVLVHDPANTLTPDERVHFDVCCGAPLSPRALEGLYELARRPVRTRESELRLKPDAVSESEPEPERITGS